MHVYNRGVDRQDIFSSPEDYDVFESLMGEWSIREGVEIHAFVLMTNHLHVLVHVPDDGLSEWMHRVAGAYATWYNQRTHRSGPLFTSRFNSIPVLGDSQMIVSARYIHRNPCEAGLVMRPDAWTWSSYRGYLDPLDGPPWLFSRVALGWLGVGGRQRYRTVGGGI